MEMKKMKRLRIITITTLCCTFLAICSCSTQKKSAASVKRPSPEKLQAILDSICIEGYNLYLAERANWMASDTAMIRLGIDNVGGSARWQTSDNVWHITFIDTTQQYCLLEAELDPKSEKLTCKYEPRPISQAEKDIVKLHERMFQNAVMKYGDSLQIANPEFGNPNFDFVRIDDQTIRMYMLQGTNKQNIIPFGLDYSFDFDYNGNIKAFSRYHQSLIPIQTVSDEGAKATTAIHSHLKNNPYITPTDICNFLLYRIPEMQQMYIYSTALDGYIIYDANSNNAIFLSSEAMKRISSND